MEKAFDFLKANKAVAFATVEGGKPKIRVFEVMKQQGNTLSLQKIATKSHKNIKNKDKAMITEDSSLPLSFEGRIGLSKR